VDLGLVGDIEVRLSELLVSVACGTGGEVMNFTFTTLGGAFFGTIGSHCQEEKTAMSPTCRNREPANAKFPIVLPGIFVLIEEFIFKK
jgi:hypothetical protein